MATSLQAMCLQALEPNYLHMDFLTCILNRVVLIP